MGFFSQSEIYYKTFAIDVSIWLNQAVKGIRGQDGGTVANAHLIGLFHRLCKLLFYKIRPIFVFDGKAPQLKLETLRKRRQARSNLMQKSDSVRAKILDNFIKRNAVATQLDGWRQIHLLIVASLGATLIVREEHVPGVHD